MDCAPAAASLFLLAVRSLASRHHVSHVAHWPAGAAAQLFPINRAQATGKKGTGRCWFQLVYSHSVAASPVAAEILARKKWSSLASSSRPSSSSCCCCCPQVRWCGRLAVLHVFCAVDSSAAGGRRQPTDDDLSEMLLQRSGRWRWRRRGRASRRATGSGAPASAGPTAPTSAGPRGSPAAGAAASAAAASAPRTATDSLAQRPAGVAVDRVATSPWLHA